MIEFSLFDLSRVTNILRHTLGFFTKTLEIFNIKVRNPFFKMEDRRRLNKTELESFTDRKDVLYKTYQSILGDKIVNIIGEKGLGKSITLRFFCDCINKQIDSKICKEYKLDSKKLNKDCFYFDINESEILKSLKLSKKDEYSIGELFAENISKKTSKNAIIILDNINEKSSYQTISKIIYDYMEIRYDDLFIIGSLDKYISVRDLDIKYIKIEKFSKTDVLEYFKKTNEKYSKIDLYIDTIYKITDGLPYFVSLLSRANISENELYQIQEKELYEILKNKVIERLEEKELDLLVLLSFINIPATVIEKNNLKTILDINTKDNFIFKQKLISKGLLIESSNNIKIHDIMKDLISRDYIKNYEQYEGRINIYMKNINDEQKIFYQLLSFYNNPSNTNNINDTIDILNKEVKKDNFPLFKKLSSIIEQLKLNFEASPILNFTIYYAIAYTYNGIGEYHFAENILKNKETQTLLRLIDIKEEKDNQNYKLKHDLLSADVLHMLNKYDDSEEKLKEIIDNLESYEYELFSQCYWKLAHIKLHKSDSSFETILEYYDKAISYQERNLNQKSYIFNAKIEKYIVELLRNRLDLLNELSDKESEFKEDTLALISFYRVLGRFYKMQQNFSEAHNNINLSYKIAEKNLSKLYNNAELEIGDILRAEGKFKDSIESYQKVIRYTKKSSDKNLELSSKLGIIISEFLSHEKILYLNKEELLYDLNEIIRDSENLKIKITYLRANIVKYFVNQELNRINEIPQKDLSVELSKTQLNYEVDVLKSSDKSKLQNMQSTIF